MTSPTTPATSRCASRCGSPTSRTRPIPGGPGPGTAQDFTFTWNVPCTATSDPNVGSNCSLFTTADTLLPGIALEGRRAIWQTDQIEVRDGAGQPFLRQGVFVP